MKYPLIEGWAKSIATFIIIVLIVQWGWNQFFPLFGLPTLNVFQATGLFLVVFIGTACISIAWNYQKPNSQHFHYDVKVPKQDETDGENL